MTNKERLIQIETKLDKLIDDFENHLKHHFWTNITLLTIIGGLVATLLCK